MLLPWAFPTSNTSVFRQEINFFHFCMPDFAIMLQKDCAEYSVIMKHLNMAFEKFWVSIKEDYLAKFILNSALKFYFCFNVYIFLWIQDSKNHVKIEILLKCLENFFSFILTYSKQLNCDYTIFVTEYLDRAYWSSSRFFQEL